jgi:adenosylmethionine-8-amino-7-oxononanoate aminotransferase
LSLNKAPKNNVFYRNQNWHYPKVNYGKGIYLYGENGKEYLDACSGSSVANIGHGNEEVAEFTAQQIKKLAFSHLSRFTTDEIETCASQITELMPTGLSHVYFVSGGSEATETCLKLARQYFLERDGKSSKWRVISRWPSFHGNTIGSLSMTGTSSRRKPYDPFLIDFPKINQAYCYRCPYKSKYPECGVACAHELEIEIKRQGAQNVMAFIAESVVGSAAPGIHPPKEYFQIVRDICTKYDVLLIIDDVMAGFGRTGKNFSCDHYDIVPDIIAIAKGMSCGYTPLGAAVTNDEIFDKIMVQGSGHFIHGHTYAGNPLSTAIGSCVLKIIKREGYIANSAKQGKYLADKLKGLSELNLVGDIRGKGLMWGLEFVKDKKTKEPFNPKEKIKDKVMQACFDNGLIIYPGGGAVDGINGDHILIAPPLNITKEEIDILYSRLEKSLSNLGLF